MSEVEEFFFQKNGKKIDSFHKKEIFLRKIVNRRIIFIKRFLNILSSPFLIILGIFSYYLGLHSACKGKNITQANCLIGMRDDFFYLLGFYLTLSVMILEVIIILIIKKYIRYVHLIYIIPLYIYFIHFYDTGSDLVHHGSYNKIAFYLIVITTGLILIFVLFIYSLFSKKKYKILCIIFLSFLMIYLLLRSKMSYNCNTWSNGLNGIKIENDPLRDKCYFIHPKKCLINFIDGIFDVSRIIGDDCKTSKKDEKKELYHYLSKDLQNSNNLAYPITLYYDIHNESFYSIFFYIIMRDMIDVEKEKNFEKGKKPEIFLKFDPETKKGHIGIKLEKNETLVKERRDNYDKLDKDEIPKYKNLLFIYIDSVSRAHFIRKMKKTQSFLEQFYGENNMYDFYQMLKYHSLLFFTFPNVHPMFYGEYSNNGNGSSILKLFKKKGYITGQAYTLCSREIYDIEDNVKNTDFETYDHENIAMFCDPNYFKIESPWRAFIGPFSFRRRCLYGFDTFEYVLEYGKQFWEAYINEPKFLRLSFIEGHEGTGEVVTLLDINLAKFLYNFQKKGYLNDTAIFFVSDHGNNMFGFQQILHFEDYFMEKSLPFWYILFPISTNDTEKKIIRENQQKLISAFDIHDTMIDMLNIKEGNYSLKGQSIFKPINSKERDCNFYDGQMPQEFCRCINYN
jgi:hypothetical protein